MKSGFKRTTSLVSLIAGIQAAANYKQEDQKTIKEMREDIIAAAEAKRLRKQNKRLANNEHLQ